MVSDNFSNIILQLARTIHVHLDTIPVALNIGIKSISKNHTPYDKDNKATWIYYKHLMQEPVTDTGTYIDGPIKLNSLDTNELIDLTPETLLVHKRTARELRTNTLFFDTILSENPGKEILLKSLLYGKKYTIEELTELKHGEILFYNKAHVEEQEYNLIPELQKRLYNFIARWDVKEYVLTDNLYAHGVMSVVTTFLIGSIHNIRLSNTRTQMVHSKYIAEYLKSNLELGEFIKTLDRNTIFWLYKNLPTLINELGTNRTNRKILDRLVSGNGFKYRFLHMVERDPIYVDTKDITKSIFVPNSEVMLFKDSDDKHVNVFKESILKREAVFIRPELRERVYGDTGIHRQFNREMSHTNGLDIMTKMIEIVSDVIYVTADIDKRFITLEALILYLNYNKDAEYVITDYFTGQHITLLASDLLVLVFKSISVITGEKLVMQNFVTDYTLDFSNIANVPNGLDPDVNGRSNAYEEQINIFKDMPKDIASLSTKEAVKEYVYSEFSIYGLMSLFNTSLHTAKSDIYTELIYNRIRGRQTVEIFQTLTNIDAAYVNTGLDFTLDKPHLEKLLDNIAYTVIGHHLTNKENETLGNIVEVLKRLTSYTVQFVSDKKEGIAQLLDSGTRVIEGIHNLSVLDYDQVCMDPAPVVSKQAAFAADRYIYATGVEELRVQETPVNKVYVTSYPDQYITKDDGLTVTIR
jgi:hypothetical protein